MSHDPTDSAADGGPADSDAADGDATDGTVASERWRIVVRGRVQGVGFRWFVVAAARELGLWGWVENLGDGSVRCEAQGELETLEAFVARVREGPPHARVDDCTVQEVPLQTATHEFEIRHRA